jgi:hypothetical protein
MAEFAQLTKKAFESYHNIPYEPAEWGMTDALGHITEFLDHHESIDEMPGLREAMQKMSLKDWEIWNQRYPEHRQSIIEPLHRAIMSQAH